MTSTATATPRPRARLEIVSDVVCPWCYIGKHRLAQGLAQLGNAADIDVVWRPFELNPTMPRAGMDREAYCVAKFGSLEHARKLYENIAANAHADGLAMDAQRIARTPNTRAAHRLIALARPGSEQNAVVDNLFKAYFVDGRDLGDTNVLIEIGAAAGLDANAISPCLTNPAYDEDITAQENEAHALGVHGVPAFIYNGRLLFTGAQSADTIAMSLKRALAKGL